MRNVFLKRHSASKQVRRTRDVVKSGIVWVLSVNGISIEYSGIESSYFVTDPCTTNVMCFKGVYPCTGKLFEYKTLVNSVRKPCLRGHRTMTIKFAPALTLTTNLN